VSSYKWSTQYQQPSSQERNCKYYLPLLDYELMEQADYPSDWDSRRKDVYRHDDYTCQNCGKLGGPQGHAELHAHHIVPKSKGGTHSKSNLVTVCKQCHNAIHGNSYAPTKSGSIPSQNSGDFFSNLSTIIGYIEIFDDVDQYSGQLSRAFDGNSSTISQVESTEQDLRTQAFQIKTELAGLNIEDAPPQATDEFIEDTKAYFDKISDSLDEVINLLDIAAKIRRESGTEDEISCPECDASVTPDMSYCSSCGTELPQWDTCPDCGQNVDVSDEYCANCGAELPEVEELVDSEIDRLIDEFTELAENITDQTDLINVMTNRVTAHTGDLNPNNDTERVGWRYCPNCGFLHSVYKPTGGTTAECFLCEASWEESGIISTKWKMESGERRGDKKSSNEWEEIGREKMRAGNLLNTPKILI
jgi:hypothetical protein